ncbi:MAG: hypothetical protein SWQ30_03745 [Thermodesulfobacteriota bacterium]|nr:hypothetical protein [Thermodesulfobacteriota bacterium]
MRRFIVSFAFWALCVFFVCGAGASEYVDPNMDSDAQESSEQSAETEDDDEEEAEPEPRRTSPRPGVTRDVKYEIDRQLKDTGLVFSPYDPGEVRPSNGQYRSFPQQTTPFFFVDDEEGEEKEDDEKDEGEKEDEQSVD